MNVGHVAVASVCLLPPSHPPPAAVVAAVFVHWLFVS